MYFACVILIWKKNVVTFYGIVEDPLCIVTDFCDEGSLTSHFKKNKEPQFFVNIILGVAAGMYHLHSEGIIHRDLGDIF